MSESIVERVGAAMMLVDRDLQNHRTDDEIRTLARAAIEEMRTPTFAMKMAGAEAITIEHMRAAANYDAADDAWQAMLSTALSEKGA